jgi:glycosyltransferase involved in cell wall biosynthesis
MISPQFSIVIPTRNRHDTLKYTLRTCLNQQFDNYEIVVCDNYSSPETKCVVESFDSEKIKYLRSPRPLAMSDNWELALSSAEGDYVTIIGDDDGLLPHSLVELDRLIAVYKFDIIRWNRIYYQWPDVAISKYANKLDIPLSGTNRTLKSKEIIPLAANGIIDYTLLPMFYNSAIKRSLIDLLREKTGRIFRSYTPDVYSGFALAYLAEEYASLGIPLGINGGSSKSNGVANSINTLDNPIMREFNLLNEESGLKWHPMVPNIKTISAAIAESFQQAKDALFPDNSNISLDIKLLIKHSVEQMQSSMGPECEEQFKRNLLQLRNLLSDNSKLQEWFDKKYLNKNFKISYVRDTHWDRGFNGRGLTLNAKDFGIKDVYGASIFCENILGYNKNNFYEPSKYYRVLDKIVKGPERINYIKDILRFIRGL